MRAPMTSQLDEASGKHTVPVIDRMMEVLEQLEQPGAGRSIRELTDRLSMPRTTVYRILNTLQLHNVVRRDETGLYHLGHRLLRLASHVPTGVSDFDLVAICQPYLDTLAAELGESIKLSVLSEGSLLVLAVAQGRREYALTVRPGQRIPLNAGAASKLLLAHSPPAEIESFLARTLPQFTPRTLADPSRLRTELARIRKLGWAQDKGEHIASICAFAAPVFSSKGRMMAALSVPFLAGADTATMDRIRHAAIDTASRITAVMPDGI